MRGTRKRYAGEKVARITGIWGQGKDPAASLAHKDRGVELKINSAPCLSGRQGKRLMVKTLTVAFGKKAEALLSLLSESKGQAAESKARGKQKQRALLALLSSPCAEKNPGRRGCVALGFSHRATAKAARQATALLTLLYLLLYTYRYIYPIY